MSGKTFLDLEFPMSHMVWYGWMQLGPQAMLTMSVDDPKWTGNCVTDQFLDSHEMLA